MEGPRALAESLQICGCSGGVDPVGQATSLLIPREKGTSPTIIGAWEHCRALQGVDGRSE